MPQSQTGDATVTDGDDLLQLVRSVREWLDAMPAALRPGSQYLSSNVGVRGPRPEPRQDADLESAAKALDLQAEALLSLAARASQAEGKWAGDIDATLAQIRTIRAMTAAH